jgi:hypothetical protein
LPFFITNVTRSVAVMSRSGSSRMATDPRGARGISRGALPAPATWPLSPSRPRLPRRHPLSRNDRST